MVNLLSGSGGFCKKWLAGQAKDDPRRAWTACASKPGDSPIPKLKDKLDKNGYRIGKEAERLAAGFSRKFHIMEFQCVQRQYPIRLPINQTKPPFTGGVMGNGVLWMGSFMETI
jgi:hypothetical protein